MGHDLPQNPKWTIVEGQIVYVCCPPCTKKVEADPKTYVTKLDKLYAASQKKEQAARQDSQSVNQSVNENLRRIGERSTNGDPPKPTAEPSAWDFIHSDSLS